MKSSILKISTVLIFCCLSLASLSQENQGMKTSIDMTMDNVGSVTCEYSTKYNAIYWDNFTRTIGNNTSILKNMLIRTFPKYQLAEFNYSQDAGERTNKIKFKMNGMLTINKDGKWEADLEKKNPDISKISDRDFLLIHEGVTMKIHLPPGTDDAKVEKNSFGKAILTYSADEGGGSGKIMMILGIIVSLAGVWLLIKGGKPAGRQAPPTNA
jgi:hypothetical protein